MGCGASVATFPERFDLPLDDKPAWRCATVKPGPKGSCLIRYDASTDYIEAELRDPPERLLQPGETLKLTIDGKAVDVRIGEPYEHAPGTRLMALNRGELVMGTVLKRLGGNQHRLRLDDRSKIDIDLNAWNHSVAGAFTVDAYQQACRAYVKALHERLSTVEDGITGNILTLAKQARSPPAHAPWSALHAHVEPRASTFS